MSQARRSLARSTLAEGSIDQYRTSLTLLVSPREQGQAVRWLVGSTAVPAALVPHSTPHHEVWGVVELVLVALRPTRTWAPSA